MKLRVLVMAALLALVSGCTITKFPTPDGKSGWSVRLADWTKIGEVSYSVGTNSMKMSGYDADRQTAAVAGYEAIKAVADKIPAP